MTSTVKHTAAPLLGLAILATLGMVPAQAQTQIFDLQYAGINGSAATATGTVTLDESKIKNPGRTQQDASSFVTAFNLTVTGATSGNGTFTLADYQGGGTVGGFYLDTEGGTLDFTKELVGQSTQGVPFGSPDGNGGDFNIFTNSVGQAAGAPTGPSYFLLTTNNGDGNDSLVLNSFKPEASAAPEPSQLAGLGFTVLGVGGLVLRARKRKAVAG